MASEIDIGHFEKRLRERLEFLDARAHQVEEALDEPPSPDFEERASEREGDEVLESLGVADVREATAIRAALKRIEDGVFGDCATCGEPISAERLEAVPHAALCRSCAK